jgi:hypothetical protein
MSQPDQYRLRVGEVVIGLNCPDGRHAADLAAYFAQDSDPARPRSSWTSTWSRMTTSRRSPTR